MRTFRPSRSGVNGIWQPSRDHSSRSLLESSRSSSSSLSGGSLGKNSGSTWTWQVAQLQQPPHSASSSSKPLSRIASITVRPSIVSISEVSPERVVTISLGMEILWSVRGRLLGNDRCNGKRGRMGLTAEQINAGLAVLAADFDSLRGCGLSRQKQGYARSLSELVASGELDLESLPADDEEAIEQLTRIT